MTTLIATAVTAGVLVGATVWWLRVRMVVVRVDGVSMEPTLRGDDRLVVRRDRPDRLRTGQIIVLERPEDRGDPDGPGDYRWTRVRAPWRRRQWLVKRVVALPGERANAKLARFAAVPAGPVPTGYCLVLGDNWSASTDSRAFGLVPLDRVLGVVVRRFGEGVALG